MTFKESTELFKLPISKMGLQQTLEFCENFRTQKPLTGGYICFVNVHTLTESLTHIALFNALTQATLLTPDGVPLLWASRLKLNPIPSRVCGPDFMHLLLTQYPNETFGFIGGQPDQIQKILQRYPVKAVTYCPPMRGYSAENAKTDWENFLSFCPNHLPPKWVFVGLGAPKQELWMNAVNPIAPESLFFGVGAAFDFLSNKKKRAPQWMQKSGLEWIHRLGSEPHRLWKRYFLTNLFFTSTLIWDVLGIDIRKSMMNLKIGSKKE